MTLEELKLIRNFIVDYDKFHIREFYDYKLIITVILDREIQIKEKEEK